MNKLSKPVFNDEEYKALVRLINTLTSWTRSYQFNKDVEKISACLQASEHINENK